MLCIFRVLRFIYFIVLYDLYSLWGEVAWIFFGNIEKSPQKTLGGLKDEG
jgi:hypothetical protein